MISNTVAPFGLATEKIIMYNNYYFIVIFNLLNIIGDDNNYEFILVTQAAIVALPILNSSAQRTITEVNWNSSSQSFNSLKKTNLSSYLAGLIESDGSIIVPAENIKSYKPFFEIVFHLEDLGLAKILQSVIGGNIQIRGENHCRLSIKKQKEVIKIIHLINGNMIKWCNYYYYGVKPGAEIIPLGLDLSPLQNNNWLSGFIDGDGSFYFNWLYDKKNLPTSLQYYMRISQRQNYHNINDLFNVSYFNIMNKIAIFLSVPLRYRTRDRKINFIESLYEVRSANYISNYTILSYLLKYPLFSYKYREIAVQLELLKLSKNKNYKLINGLKVLEDLKLKSKGTNLSPLSKTTDYFIHTSFYFPFF